MQTHSDPAQQCGLTRTTSEFLSSCKDPYFILLVPLSSSHIYRFFPFSLFPYLCLPLTHTHIVSSCSHPLTSLIVFPFYFPALFHLSFTACAFLSPFISFFILLFWRSLFLFCSASLTHSLTPRTHISTRAHTLPLSLISRVCEAVTEHTGRFENSSFFSPPLITTPNLFHGQHAVSSSFIHHSNCHLHAYTHVFSSVCVCVLLGLLAFNHSKTGLRCSFCVKMVFVKSLGEFTVATWFVLHKM